MLLWLWLASNWTDAARSRPVQAPVYCMEPQPASRPALVLFSSLYPSLSYWSIAYRFHFLVSWYSSHWKHSPFLQQASYCSLYRWGICKFAMQIALSALHVSHLVRSIASLNSVTVCCCVTQHTYLHDFMILCVTFLKNEDQIVTIPINGIPMRELATTLAY